MNQKSISKSHLDTVVRTCCGRLRPYYINRNIQYKQYKNIYINSKYLCNYACGIILLELHDCRYFSTDPPNICNKTTHLCLTRFQSHCSGDTWCPSVFVLTVVRTTALLALESVTSLAVERASCESSSTAH